MVRLEDITNMVEGDLDDFYKDRDRFKGFRMLVDFSASTYDHDAPKIEVGKPKLKKKLKVSKFIKPSNKGKSLF